MRILTVIAGIVLLLAGIWCVAFPSAGLLGVAFLLGWTMILAGLVEGGAYFWYPKKSPEAFCWMLAEALVTCGLGYLVLVNRIATDAVIPIFFGMWVLFAGATRLALALIHARARSGAWVGILVLGVLSAAAGGYAFFNPTAAAIETMPLIGVFFLLQGFNWVGNAIILPRKNRKKKT